MSFLSQIWFFYALAAAMFWGIGYVMDEKVLKAGINPLSLMFLHLILMAPFYGLLTLLFSNIGDDLKTITADQKIFWYVIISSFAVLGGNFMLFMGIAAKNATLTSLIEITYPLFVIFFTWLLFREVHINLWTALGGMLIFGGVFIIYLKS